MTIPRTIGPAAVHHQEASVLSIRALANVSGPFLETTGLVAGSMLIFNKLIEIRVDDVSWVQTEKTSITCDHPLRVAAWWHGCEISRLKKLDDLRADLYGIGDLLNRHTELSSSGKKHVTKPCGH